MREKIAIGSNLESMKSILNWNSSYLQLIFFCLGINNIFGLWLKLSFRKFGERQKLILPQNHQQFCAIFFKMTKKILSSKRRLLLDYYLFLSNRIEITFNTSKLEFFTFVIEIETIVWIMFSQRKQNNFHWYCHDCCIKTLYTHTLIHTHSDTKYIKIMHNIGKYWQNFKICNSQINMCFLKWLGGLCKCSRNNTEDEQIWMQSQPNTSINPNILPIFEYRVHSSKEALRIFIHLFTCTAYSN